MSGEISGQQGMPGMEITISNGVVKGQKLFDTELGITVLSQTQTDAEMDLSLETPNGPQTSHSIMTQRQTLSLLRVETIPETATETAGP
jgi:hypothetical protein